MQIVNKKGIARLTQVSVNSVFAVLIKFSLGDLRGLNLNSFAFCVSVYTLCGKCKMLPVV